MAPEPAPPHPRFPVPTLLVTGRDAAGRAAALRARLLTRPADQHWVLLVASPASATTEPGVETEVLASGCPCCTGLLPFRVSLTRLLRSLAGRPPGQLLIEVVNPDHVAAVRSELAREAFAAWIRLDTLPAGVASGSPA